MEHLWWLLLNNYRSYSSKGADLSFSGPLFEKKN